MDHTSDEKSPGLPLSCDSSSNENNVVVRLVPAIDYYLDRNDHEQHDALHETAAMLSTQWSRGGSPQDYFTKITMNHHGLPASYLLVREQKEEHGGSNDDGISTTTTTTTTVLGHGRLTECFESMLGNTVAATYIVIAPASRRSGYGSCLMTLLEAEAVRLGYHYMYLWTHKAVDFYKRLGYVETAQVQVYRACLKRLECEQVNRLEQMLLRAKRQQKAAILTQEEKTSSGNSENDNNNVSVKETVLLPPEEHNPESNDVWMRKRLIECVHSTLIALPERIAEIQQGLRDYHTRQNAPPRTTTLTTSPPTSQRTSIQSSSSSSSLVWKYLLVQVPWQKQVGPSCGLTALRMLREYQYSIKMDASQSLPDHLPSLLNEAKQKGYTHDGEIFNAQNLVHLAKDICQFPCCQLHAFRKSITPVDVWKSISTKRGLWIIPYDNDKITKLPCQNSGYTAHYGIIVGIVFGFSNTSAATPTTNETHNDNPNHVMDETNFQLEQICEEDVQQLENLSANGKQQQSPCQTILLVQHGLSPKLSIASWEEFFESNQQLNQTNYKKVASSPAHINLKDCIIECRFDGTPQISRTLT